MDPESGPDIDPRDRNGDGGPTPSRFMAELPAAARRALLDGAMVVNLPAGAVLSREADEPHLFIVLRGVIRAYVRSSDGRQVTVRYARPGDVLGLASAFAGPAPISLEALTAVAVAGPAIPALVRLIESDPGVARACAAELSRQLYRALDDLVSSAFEPVRQRLVRHLVELAGPGRDGRPTVVAGRQDLADAVGTSREVVARILGAMRAERLVLPERRRIVLLDPTRLAAEAGIAMPELAGTAPVAPEPRA